MDKINYAEKILNFNLIVGNQNEDIAYTYLSKTGWDENKAANLFTEENKKLDKALSIYMKNKERKQKIKICGGLYCPDFSRSHLRIRDDLTPQSNRRLALDKVRKVRR